MAKAFHNSLWIYATFCQHGTMCMSQTVGVEQVVTKFPVNDSGTVFERVRCDQFTIVFYAQWRDLFMWDCYVSPDLSDRVIWQQVSLQICTAIFQPVYFSLFYRIFQFFFKCLPYFDSAVGVILRWFDEPGLLNLVHLTFDLQFMFGKIHIFFQVYSEGLTDSCPDIVRYYKGKVKITGFWKTCKDPVKFFFGADVFSMSLCIYIYWHLTDFYRNAGIRLNIIQRQYGVIHGTLQTGQSIFYHTFGQTL